MIGPRVIEPLGAPDELVEYVAREIQVRGLCGPAVMFLEASRALPPAGQPGDAVLRPGAARPVRWDMAEVQRVMADDDGIERLIERLEEIDERPDPRRLSRRRRSALGGPDRA